MLGHQKRILMSALFISTGLALFGARTAAAETAYHLICRSGGNTVEVNLDAHSLGFVTTDENQTRYSGTSSDIRHRLAPGQCSWATRPIYTGDYGWGPVTGYSGPSPFFFYFLSNKDSDPNYFTTTNTLARLQPSDEDILANIYVYQRKYNGRNYLVVRNATLQAF